MRRVGIHPADRTDSDDLIRANLASREHHAPWVQPFADLDGFNLWFRGIEAGSRISLIGRRADTGDVVGVVNISEIVQGLFQSAYLGFYGMAKHAGQGFMTEMLNLSAEFAFEQIGLHRLEANIQPENTRSIALVRRVGFNKEGFSPRYLKIDGQWRDHERWALLADEK